MSTQLVYPDPSTVEIEMPLLSLVAKLARPEFHAPALSRVRRLPMIRMRNKTHPLLLYSPNVT